MVNVIVSLLHMDNISLELVHFDSPRSHSEADSERIREYTDMNCEGRNKMVISFTGFLLDTLRHNLPPAIMEQEQELSDTISIGGRQALGWRITIAKHFIEDWEWRLSVLQRLLPLSERQWSWKEALAVLRAAPSKLLNL